MANTVQVYSRFNVFLHWVMALGFFTMIASGLTLEFAELPQKLKFNMYQWHKSLGVLLLLAFVVRVGVRIFSKTPSLPETFLKPDRVAAKLGHYALYIWMLVVPLSGWAMVSSSPYGVPTIVFGWFTWPHIPGAEGNDLVHDFARQAHGYLAYAFIGLIVVHIAAVIKHRVKDKTNLLPRMWFSLVLVFILFLPMTSLASEYQVDYDQSKITFSSTHAGENFTGHFNSWQAQIDFDENDLANSFAKVIFKTDTATTRNTLYDETLPKADWFDLKNYKTAVFETTDIDAKEGTGAYRAKGNLTIKDKTVPIEFDFSLADLQEGGVNMTASFSVYRLDYNIGAKSDPDAEWVTNEIKIDINLVATKVN